jgi:hypothetical protein
MKTLTWKSFEEFGPCYDPKEKYGDWSGTEFFKTLPS